MLHLPAAMKSKNIGKRSPQGRTQGYSKSGSMVGQKLTFLRQILLNVRQNMSVLVKNMQILG